MMEGGCLLDLFYESLRLVPSKAALVDAKRRITYEQLDVAASAFARHMLAEGVGEGDIVGCYMKNHVYVPVVYVAVLKLGAILLPLNERIASNEVDETMREVGCRILVTDLGQPMLADQFACMRSPRLIFDVSRNGLGRLPKGARVIRADFGGCGEGPLQLPASVSGNSVSRLQPTGGTTGRSKIVVRTHAQDVASVTSSVKNSRLNVHGDEVFLAQVPMSHHGGFISLWSALASGATFVVCSRFDPDSIPRIIQELRVTYLLLLPPSGYLRIDGSAGFDLSSVRTVRSAAGSNNRAVVDHIFRTFPNASIGYSWGSTESGAGTSVCLTRENFLDELSDEANIGFPMPFVEIRIVDGSGRDSDEGEALVRGAALASGYYSREAVGAIPWAGGWFATGDVLRRDESGRFFFVGRKKDMIKSGGENVFAQEVEAVVQQHPAVDACAVIGVPDERLSEAVCAVVKLREGRSLTLEELQLFFKERSSSFKKPMRLWLCDDFPIDGMGKVRKSELRERYLGAHAGLRAPIGGCRV